MTDRDRPYRAAALARQLRALGADVAFARSRFIVTYQGRTARHRYLSMAARAVGVGC